MEGEIDPADLERRLKDIRSKAYKLAKKRVSADDAEDVAQYVTEAIQRRIAHLPRLLAKEGELTAYITTAVKNRCEDLRKRKKAEEVRLVEGEERLYSRSSVLDPEHFMYMDDRTFFEKHHEELTRQESQAVFYRFVCGYSGVHTAELMGRITPQSVNTYKKRGLAKLEKLYKRPVVVPAPKWERLHNPPAEPPRKRIVQAEFALVYGLPGTSRAVVTRRPRDRGVAVVLFDAITVSPMDLLLGMKAAVDVFERLGRDVPGPSQAVVNTDDPPLQAAISAERTLKAFRHLLSSPEARDERNVEGFGPVKVVGADIPA